MNVNPVILRGFLFGGVLLTMAVAERCWPRRQRSQPSARRWLGNLLLAASGSGLVWLVLFLAPLGGAVLADLGNWGLMAWLDWPAWLRVVVGLVVLDLAVWLQHRAFHAWGWAWRLHRVHHADLDLDTSSGIRFHPLEIVISAGWKLAVVLLFGIGPATFIAFEILLNACSLFNHANVRLAGDRWVRLLVVTPDMHRVHHSIHREEHDRNFAFCLSIWDHLLRTYKAQPDAGHNGMTIGLDRFRTKREAGILRLLTMPFRNGR